MKCNSQADLYYKMLEVYDFCKGTSLEGKEWECVKFQGAVRKAPLNFSRNPCDYDFALGIVEDKLVWEDSILYDPAGVPHKMGDMPSPNFSGYWSWNPPTPPKPKMDINETAAKQYAWVERMGWHNKTVLEALALIASEVGEAVNECRSDVPTPEFGTELADIILRVFDLAHWQNIDLAAVIAAKMEVNEVRGTRGRSI